MSVLYSQDFVDGYKECLQDLNLAFHTITSKHNNGEKASDIVNIHNDFTLSLYQQAFHAQELQRAVDENPSVLHLVGNKEDA